MWDFTHTCNSTEVSILLISYEFRIKPLLGALELISIVIIVISLSPRLDFKFRSYDVINLSLLGMVSI